MERTPVQKTIDLIRNATPLWLRKNIGPLLGYVSYIYNVYMLRDPDFPVVLSIADTIELIKKEDLSVIRFGDGEMSLIDDSDLEFQKKSADLAEKLRTVLQANRVGLLICVLPIFKKLDNFTSRSFWFTIHHLFRYRHIWKNLLSPERIYGNAFITRPYLSFIDRSESGTAFKELFSLWKDKEVVLIEGSKSRLGVGNDMFKGVRSLGRLLCPPENAFSRYEAIKTEALKLDKNKLILISLGPAAKVLAYDMFLAGYRVIDVGHIDMEYEMFLRKETKLSKVRYKYFNEIGERDPEECTDEGYTGQILAKII